MLWSFEGDVMDGAPVITGPGQSFFNPDTVQFATLDPAVLGGNANQLGHIQNLLSSIGRRGFDRSDAPVMQIADASGSTGLDLAWFHDIRPWVGAFGGQYEHSADEMMFAHDIEFQGAALGVSARMGRAFRLAFTAGYLQGTQEAHGQYSNSYSLETDGIFAGIATRYRLWDVDFDFGIIGAMLNYESERLVQDNLAPLGRGYPKASYDGWLISPEIGISAPINLSDIVTVRPGLRVAYTHHAIPSYSEDGRGELTVDDQTLALLSTTAEITVEKKLFGIATVHATGGYTMRTNVGDTSASVTLVGVSQDFELPDTDGEAYFVGGGITVHLHDIWDTVRLAAEATVIEGKDYTGIEGMARVSVAF